MNIRPEVMRFAERMELSLREHDETRGKTGWKDVTVVSLYTRFLEEVDETEIAILNWHQDTSNIFATRDLSDEIVDVACLGMMVIDNLGELENE